MTEPFVIYSLPRTGSTTLMKLVNAQAGMRCVFEPFNPDNSTALAVKCQEICRVYGLDAALKALWGVSNGIKHVWRRNGWPFTAIDGIENLTAQEANRHVLLCGARVILLTRRNALRRAISEQLSEQTGLWVFANEAERERLKDRVFGPLDIGRLRAEIGAERGATESVRAVLRTRASVWREEWYEDWFGAGVPIAAQMERLQSLLAFIGAGPAIEESRLAEMRRFFVPSVTGFENAVYYERIPNIREVEHILGCRETGFVFS